MKISHYLASRLSCVFDVEGEPSLRIIKVCSTSEDRAKGLQGHAPIKSNEGMLFAWDDDDYRIFHTRNVAFPLDVTGISNEKVVSVNRSVPPESEGIRTEPSTFVIECNGGWAKRNEVVVGTKVAFEGLQTHTSPSLPSGSFKRCENETQ